MPIYEYQCQSCRRKTSLLWRNFSPPDSTTCRSCGSEETARVVSTFSFHRSLDSKLSDLDPRYDGMVDAAAESTSEADPYSYLDRMESLSEADE